MIDTSLTTITAELNTYIRTKFSLSTDAVIMSDIPLTEPDEDAASPLFVTLISIEEDKLGTQKHSPKKKFVSLNLYVLFSANFTASNNVDALKYISAVISFFGAKPEFKAENTPGLDPSIEEISFDIHNLTFQERDNMWSSIGVRSRPSVLYKVYGVPVSVEEEE
ncbi:MAG: DUF4255 domain-containing protein [Bacteroidota bacterium]|nr:DUF4255 domain-containing protein [Bacteroidota bacterium]